MKRLRDERAATPLMQKAQLLIDAVDPVPESRERMLRIRRQLDQPRPRFAAIGGTAPALRGGTSIRRLPALALATLVVLFGASAFAAVRMFVERLAPAAAPATPAASGGVLRRAHHAPQNSAAPRVSDTAPALRGSASMPIAPVSPPHPAPSEPAVTTPAPSPARRTEPRVHAKPRPAVAAPSLVAGDDSVLVHRALEALRHDDDPALAARLLLENRAQNPGGPLAEEALSLQIEAASALRDPKARQFAREYLNRYPGGRYLSVARRALASLGSAP
jgi:hypothetical protein